MNLRLKFLAWAALSLSTHQLARAAAPDYFRLEPGSVRIYRAQGSHETFKITVGGIGLMHDGHVHYSVNGYVNRPVLVYQDENTGALYHLDEEAGNDVLITSIAGPGWFDAPYRACNQLGTPEESGDAYEGPAGRFGRVLSIEYRTFGCFDAGVISERYVQNIGLVQRKIQTIAGPVTYDLVHSSAGAVSGTEAPSASFTMTLRALDRSRMSADLRFSAVGERFAWIRPTSQEYDVVLRDVEGTELWRWSNGRYFTPVTNFRYARHFAYEVEIPLQLNGILLPDGFYTVEAWLNTQPEKQFAASANFLLNTAESAAEQRRR